MTIAKPTQWILFIGIVLATIFFWQSWKKQTRNWREEFNQDVLENALILSGKLEVAERELMGILSLYRSSGEVAREDFRTFVTPILKNQNFIQRFEWIPRVAEEEREFYEIRARQEGLLDFQIGSSENGGQNPTEDFREDLFPVYYVEPLEKNEYDLGLDLGTVPRIRAGIDQIIALGLPSTTDRIRKTGDTNGPVWIRILLPFYEGREAPKSAEARNDHLRGFIGVVYQVDKMMEQMAKPYLSRGNHLVIYEDDDQDPDNRIYGDPLENPILENKSVSNFAGRVWFLVWQGTREFQNGPDRIPAMYVGGGTFLLTLFIATIFQILATRTRAIENQVRLRTEELTQANQQLRKEIEGRIEAEGKLQLAKKDAELANRSKSSFLANMSHEIRTPMNAILGYAQILDRQDDLEMESRSNIRKILSGGKHLMQIINDILDISKIEAGKVELTVTDFDLMALLDEVDTMIRPRAEEKKIDWRVETSLPRPLPVRGDEIKLKQVLLNLSGNAVKFMETGWVRLNLDPVGEHRYRFEVADSGRGIPPRIHKIIFEPFEQDAEGMKKGGAGLGLAISKKSIELMGGTLALESEVNQGARFFFTLTLPPAHQTPVREEESIKTVRGLAPGHRVAAVIADDNEQNREVLEKILSSIGVRIWTARDGMEALDLALKHRPDIVFLDMRMPVMNGFEAAKQIRIQFPVNSIKIVGVSASAMEDERNFFLGEGCDFFISKPFRLETVLSCLQKLLGVEFVYEITPEAPVLAPVSDSSPPLRNLPSGLMERACQAARLHNLTGLKSCLRDLEMEGECGKTLVERLKPLVSRYDMDGILAVLNQVRGPN
ncbi:MAG: hypothetical protein COV67_02810 [Nitrospinae bacterium CG11_big_fil_rev_8_21_14_0_20_56_8]|nr:MAG: hypothetical protein COV67_02810 [Nitrospinae bacterium CG11_big_fil_rev_8_21_14_0_20_56_8]